MVSTVHMISALPRRATLLAFVLAAACRSGGTRPSDTVGGRAAPDSVMIRRDIETLASEKFEGRRTGTPGNDSAAAYLAGRYAALRLLPAPDVSSHCGAGCAAAYIRRFIATEPVRGGPPAQMPTQNVVGMIAGTDPALKNEYVVIGAHFDHLGRSTVGALDPDHGSEIRNGRFS